MNYWLIVDRHWFSLLLHSVEIRPMTNRNDRILLWLSALPGKIGLFLLAVQEEIDK